jgi:3-deoxy-D-manno-octulosonic-acid transferase
MGEFEQGRPLLEALKHQYPQYPIVLTCFSPSGFEAMEGYQSAESVFYLPLDTPQRAAKMVKAMQPALVVWIKYEFWYHHLGALQKNNVPVLMVAGLFRSSQPFFKWYGGQWRKLLGCFRWFFVQNEESKDLLAKLDIHKNVSLGGDPRFDRVLELAAQPFSLPRVEAFCKDHRVIVIGSSWEEDEAEWAHYVKIHPEIRFIIAPHEIDPANISDVQKTFPNNILFSQLNNGDKLGTENVLIIDNMGLLSRLYRFADITYVGGGFAESGIHNVLEPAVYGKPILFGPEYQKFAEAMELVAIGAGIPVHHAVELELLLNQLWDDPNLLAAKGRAAADYVKAGAGATSYVMHYIQENRLLIS